VTTFALDTATPDPALAILGNGDVLAEAWLGRTPGGGRRILEASHHLFAMAGVEPGDLDEIVVGIGPGGFTGIRIGIATALGLGQALGIPVHGASTLEALALGAAAARRTDTEVVVPVIDARRGQVFAGAYVVGPGGSLSPVLAPAAWDPAALSTALSAVGACLLAGDGADLVDLPPQARRAPPGAADRISPVQLVARVRADGPRPVTPEYLRLPDAEENRLRREREAART
jgi:tRNA threonylcarbamoyladenosine biosynthesis protein TsaB